MKYAIMLEANIIISTTTTAIATVIPITRQSTPFTHEPSGSGVSLMVVVEGRNRLEVAVQVPGIPTK